MARKKKKRGPGRPKGSKTKAKRGRPPKAAAKKKGYKLAAGKRRGRPPGSKTKSIATNPTADALLKALGELSAHLGRMAGSLDTLTRPAPTATDYAQLKRAEPTTQAATRVGAQAQPIHADQGVQAQV